MERYRVTAAMGVRFNQGAVLALSAEQAARRSAQVVPAGKGLYRVRDGGSVMFKHGEVLGVDGPVNKALLSQMEPMRTDAAAELAEARGVDLATVKGTGKGGSITVADVRAAADAKMKAKAEAEAEAARKGEAEKGEAGSAAAGPSLV